MVSVNGVAGEEVGEFNPSTGHWSRYTLWVGGQRVYVFSNSGYRMYHANVLKSATMTTDQTGTVIEDQNFYPWGQKWNDEVTSMEYRFFAGMKQQDWKTGIDPALHRDLNPTMGRWLTPDPGGKKVVQLDNPQTWNLYAYVTNNPMTLNDPSGLGACPPDCGLDEDIETAVRDLVESATGALEKGSGDLLTAAGAAVAAPLAISSTPVMGSGPIAAKHEAELRSYRVHKLKGRPAGTQ